MPALSWRDTLDRAAADRALVEAFHFPFPVCDHMVKRGTSSELVPVEWQPLWERLERHPSAQHDCPARLRIGIVDSLCRRACDGVVEIAHIEEVENR